MPETRSTSESMAIVAQNLAEMSQKMNQLVQAQSDYRATFTGLFEQLRGEMQELKLSQAKADCQNDAEEKSSSDQHQYVSLSTKPDLIFDDTTKIVAGVNDEDLDGIDFDLYSDWVSEDATEGVVCDDPILLVESAPRNSIKSLDILSDLALVKPTTGYIVYTDDFSIVSGLNKREIVGWNEASGLENLFGVLCNTLSSCLPTVCENASVYLPSFSLAHETFNGNWCSVQLFYMAAVCPNPPWEPPDDRNYPLLCVDNDLVLSKPTAIGTPRLGMGSSNSDIGLEDLALDSDSTSPIEKLVKYGMSNLDEGLFMGESLLKELEGLSKYKGTGKQHISSNENRPHLVDSILYSSLIDGPCKDGREKNALDMFSLMVEKGSEPTLLTSNSLIEGLCHEDVMLNDESKQETPAVDCLGEKQRFIGTAGAASTMINPKKAISQIKRLIGRQFSDPELQKNLAGFPFCVKEGQDGYPLITVQYLGETRSFTPTQLLGMVLSILKGIAEKNLGAASMDYSSYFMMRTNSDSYILVPEMKTDDLSVLLRNMNDFNEVESSLVCRLQLRTCIKGVQRCRYVKFVDGNYVYDKGRSDMYDNEWYGAVVKEDMKVKRGAVTYNSLLAALSKYELLSYSLPNRRPSSLPSENVFKIEGYMKERKMSDIVSCLKDELYPEDVRNSKPKLHLLVALISLCAAERSLSNQVLVRCDMVMPISELVDADTENVISKAISEHLHISGSIVDVSHELKLCSSIFSPGSQSVAMDTSDFCIKGVQQYAPEILIHTLLPPAKPPDGLFPDSELLSDNFLAAGLTTVTPTHFVVPNINGRDGDHSVMYVAYQPPHAVVTNDLKYDYKSMQGYVRSSANEIIGRVTTGTCASTKNILKLYSWSGALAFVSQIYKAVLDKESDHEIWTSDQIESNIQNMFLKVIRKYLAKKNGYGVLNMVDIIDKYVVGLLKELFVVSPRESVRKH